MAEHKPVYYGDYLRLDQLLSCQHPESKRLGKAAHDEMLFITVHQTYELWFKQVIYELDGVQRAFAGPVLDDRAMAPVVRSLDRVREILRLLIQQVDVLETMTPLDFLDFRDLLYPASGFQSWQFRLIEVRLGLRLSVGEPRGTRPVLGSVFELAPLLESIGRLGTFQEGGAWTGQIARRGNRRHKHQHRGREQEESIHVPRISSAAIAAVFRG